MIRDEILESIDNIYDVTMESGMTVDSAILELCDKYNMIIQETDMDYISSYNIYQEAAYTKDDANGSIFKKVFNTIKDVIKRLITLIKTTFNKIFGKIKSAGAGKKTKHLINDYKVNKKKSELAKIAAKYGLAVSIALIPAAVIGPIVGMANTKIISFVFDHVERKYNPIKALEQEAKKKKTVKNPVIDAENIYLDKGNKDYRENNKKRFTNEIRITIVSPDSIKVETSYNFKAVRSAVDKINKCLKSKATLCEKYQAIELMNKKRKSLLDFNDEVVGLAEHLVSSAYGDKKQVYEYNEDEIKHMLDSITECEKILSDLSDNKEYQKLVKSNKKIYDKEVKLNKIIMELIRECYSNINTVDGLITEMFAAKWDNDSAYDENIIKELRKMLMKANLSRDASADDVTGDSTIKAYPFLCTPSTNGKTSYNEIYKYPGIPADKSSYKDIFKQRFGENFSLTHAHYEASKETYSPFITTLGRGYIVIGYAIDTLKAAGYNNIKLEEDTKNGKTTTKYFTDNNGKSIVAPCGFVLNYEDIINNGIPQITPKMCFDVYMKYQKEHWNDTSTSPTNAYNVSLKAVKL